MHIKQITISNFRSFKQQGEVQPFSPATNTIVGRNGSGKSNLFDAVQFCLLAPKFAHLRQEERQALLHEGSGSAAVNAFVEIVFDNSDHRFQHENSDEVVLRRTIGLKKDEFFLQRKRTAKNEIQSLLEGAGFSKSNPYYIVQQGKVQDLCTMNDAARLRLLKEVAGTTVYDEKKAESLAKMEENNNSIAQISDMLQNIEERLQELNAEKDELTEYQNLDRSRRAAQYGLYSLELQKARSQLDQIEHQRMEHVELMNELQDKAKETHDAIRSLTGTQKTKANAYKRVRNNVKSLESDKNEAVKVYTKLKLECDSLEEAVKAGEEQEKSNKRKLVALEEEITKVEKELDEIVRPKFDETTSALQKLKDEEENAKKEIDALYAKQGRGRMFNSVEERDNHLRSSCQEVEATRSDKESQLNSKRDTLANLRRSVEKEASDLERLQGEVSKMSETQQSLSKSNDEKGRQRLQLNDSRRENWRKTEELQEQVREARETLHNCLSDTKKVMPRATSLGIEALKAIVEQERLVYGEQYFGMVMENFKLTNEKYQTAVEAAAQNSLFHVIVDNDHTAARLMKRLEDGKLGRVTFLPLNQLRIEQVNYPDSNDVKSMLGNCITYDQKVEQAMHHVFDKKLIARNAEIASDWSTRLGMDAITLDGDLCSRKGALTGGFVDMQKSRLRAYSKQLEAQDNLQKLEREYQEMKGHAQEVDQNMTNLMEELHRLQAKQAQLNNKLADAEKQITRLEKKRENHMKQIETVEKTTIPALEKSISSLTGDIERLQAEMGTELQETLTDQERERLRELKELQHSLVPKIEAQQDEVEKYTMKKQKLESQLHNNLLKKRSELTEGLSNEEEEPGKRRRSSGRKSLVDLQVQRKQELEERRRDCEEALRAKEAAEERLEKVREEEKELRQEQLSLRNEHNRLRELDDKNLQACEEAKEKAERFLTKRATYTSKRESNMRKIQELGSLPPPSELKKYSNKSLSQLEKALDSINKQLKKYSHVNKKAFDQYVNFSETRESLLKRKEELDRGAEKVMELIESLDQKKDEAINRTFRGVSTHFKEVFKELVPNGAGELIMRTALDEESEDAGTTDEESSDGVDSPANKKRKASKESPDVSLYRGIGVKVRFAEVGENFMMSQLSGGQKALVALTMIFAIQRCDPAPFYLFDELDQALDPTYRAAVANVIQRQANDPENPTQFIVSTFRQELVAVANRCYGISHQNKVSSVHHMPKKDAQSFIANLMSEEEALGEVTTVTKSRVSRSSLKRKAVERLEEVKETDEENETDEDESATSEAA